MMPSATTKGVLIQTLIALSLALGLNGSPYAQHQPPPKRLPAGKAPAAKVTPAAGEWAHEPSTVLGLTFGKELPEGVLLPCVKLTDPAVKTPLGFCDDSIPGYHSASRTSVTAFSISEFKSGILYREEGAVVSLGIIAKQSDYVTIKALLITRYGTPTEQVSRAVKTRAGSEWPSEELTWKGKRMTLSVSERAGQIDQTVIEFSDNEYLRRQAAAFEKRTTDSANKL